MGGAASRLKQKFFKKDKQEKKPKHQKRKPQVTKNRDGTFIVRLDDDYDQLHPGGSSKSPPIPSCLLNDRMTEVQKWVNSSSDLSNSDYDSISQNLGFRKKQMTTKDDAKQNQPKEQLHLAPEEVKDSEKAVFQQTENDKEKQNPAPAETDLEIEGSDVKESNHENDHEIEDGVQEEKRESNKVDEKESEGMTPASDKADEKSSRDEDEQSGLPQNVVTNAAEEKGSGSEVSSPSKAGIPAADEEQSQAIEPCPPKAAEIKISEDEEDPENSFQKADSRATQQNVETTSVTLNSSVPTLSNASTISHPNEDVDNCDAETGRKSKAQALNHQSSKVSDTDDWEDCEPSLSNLQTSASKGEETDGIESQKRRVKIEKGGQNSNSSEVSRDLGIHTNDGIDGGKIANSIILDLN